MTSYFDASVIVASMLDESRTPEARDLIDDADARMTSPLSLLEARRAVKFAHDSSEPKRVLQKLSDTLDAFFYVGGNGEIWERAADIAEKTGVKSLDAIHLAAATYLEIDELQFVTFDKKQADAARAIGLTVVGA
jgi:predicted nucleic acid-binding protein